MGTPSLDAMLREELQGWEAAGLTRTIAPSRGLDVCTNDYLGLAGDARLAEAAIAAIRSCGVGSRAARLLGGHTDVHGAAERAAAAWQGTAAALLCPSGYHANLAVVGALCGAGDVILSDAGNHASLIDAARLSRATVEVFAHHDPADLERRLATAGGFRHRWIVVESVHSMDGGQAPLEIYADLARTHDAWLLVDEAHAAGMVGPRGAGLAATLPRVAARTITGGKALGVAGAFLVGSRTTIRKVLHAGRAFVFTTSPMPALAAALERAIAIVQEDGARRALPRARADHLRARLSERGVTAGGTSAIVSVEVGEAGQAIEVAARLQEAGFDARAVRPPTVPEGRSGLRLVCHADHDLETLDRLADVLAAAWPGAASTSPAPATRVPLVVAGTDTDVGKTVVSALLVRAARRAGLDPRYLKPVQTGSELDTDTVARLGGLSREAAPPAPVHLALPASVDQAAEAEQRHVGVEGVLAATREAIAQAPGAQWILETAGGLLVPYGPREVQADLLVALGAPVVLVARSGLGTLNHTLLTIEAMRRRGLSLRALVLVGPPHAANRRTLTGRLPGLAVHELPPLAALTEDALESWLDTVDLAECFR